MAVAGVIETRAYFRRQRTTGCSNPDLPRKHKRLETPQPADDDSPMLSSEDFGHLPPDPSQSPTLNSIPDPSSSPRNSAISGIVHKALSFPWAGPVDLRYEDKNPEDSDDVSCRTTQPIPAPGSDTEPRSSDVDFSEADDSEVEFGESSAGRFPDIFETDADLNATEYSESFGCVNLLYQYSMLTNATAARSTH
jgi:hypothetical protein